MKSNLYEEKKHFNGIDVLIVVLLILITAVIIFRSQLLSLFTSSGQKETCEITFVCESIQKDVFEANVKQSAKNTLTWTDAEDKLGKMTILNESIANARIYEKQPDGSLNVTLSETDVRFSGTVKTTLISNNGYYLGGTNFIAPGMRITVATELAEFEILIVNIQPT